MIEARHDPAFARLFAAYAARLLRSHFASVRVRGTLPGGDAPLLVAAQHVGWWDPIVLFHLSRRRFGGTHYVMQEEARLREFTFFRRLGAFGVDLSEPARALPSVRYALARLRAPGARLWVFPQGELRPADARPIRCRAGAEWLAARARARVVPVALRYEFLAAQRPEAFVSIGEPVALAPREPAALERLLTAEADRLRNDVLAGRLDGFDVVSRGRRSVSDAFLALSPRRVLRRGAK